MLLHNICIENNLPEPEGDENIDFGMYDVPNNIEAEDGLHHHRNQDLEDGHRLQQHIIRNYFQL